MALMYSTVLDRAWATDDSGACKRDGASRSIEKAERSCLPARWPHHSLWTGCRHGTGGGGGEPGAMMESVCNDRAPVLNAGAPLCRKLRRRGSDRQPASAQPSRSSAARPHGGPPLQDSVAQWRSILVGKTSALSPPLPACTCWPRSCIRGREGRLWLWISGPTLVEVQQGTPLIFLPREESRVPPAGWCG